MTNESRKTGNAGKTQKENYTSEQVEELVSAYQAEQDQAGRDRVVRDYADLFGKSVRSIRAKLAREGVYISKKAAASANKREKKADIVEDIAASIGRDSESLDSLEKANAGALRAVRDSLASGDDSNADE